MKKEIIKATVFLVVFLVSCIVAARTLCIPTEENVEEEVVFLREYNWVEEDSLLLTSDYIDDWLLAEDAPVILGTYKGKDIAISCEAWQLIFAEEEPLMLYKSKWGEYISHDEFIKE